LCAADFQLFSKNSKLVIGRRLKEVFNKKVRSPKSEKEKKLTNLS
jgi:hypothetical protein